MPNFAMDLANFNLQVTLNIKNVEKITLHQQINFKKNGRAASWELTQCTILKILPMNIINLFELELENNKQIFQFWKY
jgi:hypothetical protein